MVCSYQLYHETPTWWHGERYLAAVARTDCAMPRQAFGRIGGKGPAGPTRAAVLRSRRTASVRRRWTGHSALTKRRSSPSSNRGGQARPFPTSARRPVVARQKVRSDIAKACDGRAQGPRHQGKMSMAIGHERLRPCATKRQACSTGLREDASCTCPVSFCLLVTYNFSLRTRG